MQTQGFGPSSPDTPFEGDTRLSMHGVGQDHVHIAESASKTPYILLLVCVYTFLAVVQKKVGICCSTFFAVPLCYTYVGSIKTQLLHPAFYGTCQLLHFSKNIQFHQLVGLYFEALLLFSRIPEKCGKIK